MYVFILLPIQILPAQQWDTPTHTIIEDNHSVVFRIWYNFKSYKKQSFLHIFPFCHYGIFVKVEKILFYLLVC